MFRHKALCCLFVAAMVTAMVLPTQAGTTGVNETVMLSQLIQGDEIIVEDKRFHAFTYNLAEGELTPDQIAVTGIIADVMQNGELVPGYGLLFSGDFSAGGLSGPPIFEAGLAFRIDVLDDRYLISDVHLDGTTFVEGTGDARITENFGGINVPSLSIRDLRVNDEILVSRSSDDILFSDVLENTIGFSGLSVLKDIRIEAGDNTPLDIAEITTFRQLFTQTLIPEPSTITIAAICGISILAGKRYKLMQPTD